MYHLLAGSVEDVKKTGFSVNDDLLPVAVLDGGVILVYEVVLDELDGEGGLADSASCNESGCYVLSQHFPRNAARHHHASPHLVKTENTEQHE